MDGHPYVATAVDRTRFVARLAIGAVAVSGGLGLLLTHVGGALGAALGSPGALVVFGALFWVYDRRLWRLRPFGLTLSPIPDLNGEWEGWVTVKQGAEAGEEDALACRVNISQTWTHILVELETELNRSHSLSATLGAPGQTIGGLHYEYAVRPRGDGHDMKAHTGFSRMGPCLGSWDALEGDFFTDRDFLRHGEIVLRRTGAVGARAPVVARS